MVLTGVATDQCILASAIDARMRELEVVVASDGTAAMSVQRHRNALAVLREMDVKTMPCASVRA